MKDLDPKTSLEAYVFSCWRRGSKLSKMAEDYHKEITEKELSDKFKYVFDSHFGLI